MNALLSALNDKRLLQGKKKYKNKKNLGVLSEAGFCRHLRPSWLLADPAVQHRAPTAPSAGSSQGRDLRGQAEGLGQVEISIMWGFKLLNRFMS